MKNKSIVYKSEPYYNQGPNGRYRYGGQVIDIKYSDGTWHTIRAKQDTHRAYKLH